MSTFKSSSSKGYTLRLEVTEKSYSVEQNNSILEWKLYLDSTTYYFQTSGNKANVNIDGNVYNNTNLNVYMTGPQSVLIASGNKTVAHNDLGSKTVNVSASFSPSSSASYMPPGLSLSGSLKLTDIPRASTISCSSPYIGDNAIITVGKKASNYTNTISYQIGELTGTIAEKTSDIILQLETEPLKEQIYSLMPNSKSVNGTINCITYDGDKQVGNQTTAKFTLYAKEDECKPDVTVEVIDTNETAIALTNDNSKLIKYISKPKVTINATAKYSSEIKEYTISLDGQAVNEQEHIFDEIVSNTLVANATDSRSYSNPQTQQLEIIDYVKLHVNSFDVYRPEDTSNEIMLNLKGVWFNNYLGETTKNILNASFQYRENGQTEWIDGENISLITEGDTFEVNNYSLGSVYNFQKEYQIKIIVSDLLMTVGKDDKESQTVPKGQETFAIGEDGGWLYGDWFLNDKNIEDFYVEPENCIDDEIIETNEYINGKRVYKKRIVVHTLLSTDTVLRIKHGIQDFTEMWIDGSDSYFYHSNKVGVPITANYYTSTSNQFVSATIQGEDLLLISNGSYNTSWKKVITLKFIL